jgi:hypothetical protein
MTAGTARFRQSLDSIGRLHFAVHQAMRDLGYPGFACQLHVWLGGRLDPAVLGHALDNLGRRYPLLISRIRREEGRRGDIYWEPSEGARCPLTVTQLDTATEAAVHGHAATLFSTPFELLAGEPIRFHLVQRPGAGDVLIVYYDHTLIGDAHGAERLIEELDSLAATPTGEVRPVGPEPNELDPYIRKHGFWSRWFKVVRMLSAMGKLPPALNLMPDSTAEPALDRCRISVGALDEAQTRAFVDRVKRVCGFPNVSLALMASCFRALHAAAGSPQDSNRSVATGVGYSLRSEGRGGTMFRWFGTEMILAADLDQLQDRDALLRSLVQDMRSRLRQGYDLGSLQMARIGSRHVERVRRAFIRRMKELSFAYGYFRPSSEGERTLCGASVERVHHVIMPWSPPGLTVSATTCHGRLEILVATCVESVPEPTARTFLDRLIADLADEPV